ncbi:hypothetical protein N9N28_16510 [Rubripirellula amarantea]|nr:hypothetical protein [Rubripirellula amarantea]
MRTLTLGVLIVTGGTLAALPFRRATVVPDASSVPTQATGPMESILDAPPVHQLVSQLDDGEKLVLLNEVESAGDASIAFTDYSIRRPRQTQRRPSRIDAPLTFEDLLEPIERPDSTKERLGAIAEISDQKRSQDRLAVMDVAPSTAPPTIMPVVAPTTERFVALEPTREYPSSRAAGSLASAKPSYDMPVETASPSPLRFQDRSLETLPKPEVDAAPKRHWIMQP